MTTSTTNRRRDNAATLQAARLLASERSIDLTSAFRLVRQEEDGVAPVPARQAFAESSGSSSDSGDHAIEAELGRALFNEAARRGEPITMKEAILRAARQVHGTRSEHEAAAFAERQRRMPDSAELDRRALARLRERGLTMSEPGAYKAALLEVSAEAVR